jgi:tagatose-1,6-bisphosphate aldolase non-catalytic subunit AgaZ/GatZ
MKDTKLTVTLHIGGKQVESLSPEQCERMAQKLSETMSLYYTAHSEEYQKIKQ